MDATRREACGFLASWVIRVTVESSAGPGRNLSRWVHPHPSRAYHRSVQGGKIFFDGQQVVSEEG